MEGIRMLKKLGIFLCNILGELEFIIVSLFLVLFVIIFIRDDKEGKPSEVNRKLTGS